MGEGGGTDGLRTRSTVLPAGAIAVILVAVGVASFGHDPAERTDRRREPAYVPHELECRADSGVTQFTDYVNNARGPTGDPVEITPRMYPGIAPSDVVERAGYLEERRSTTRAIVRVVRGGRVVLVSLLWSDRHGGWLEDELHFCGRPDIRGL